MMKLNNDIQGFAMHFWAILTKCFFALIFVLLIDTHYSYPSPQTLPGRAPRIYALASGDSLQDTLTDSIGQAKKSIVLIIYSLRDWKVIGALNDKAESGVDVTIIYDHLASENIEQHLSKKIHVFSRAGPGLMHLKLLIIDEAHAWLGSSNFTRSGLKQDANLILHVNQEECAKHLLKKAQQFTQDPLEIPLPAFIFKAGRQALELRFLPDDKEAVTRIKDLIGSAKKTLQVAMYTFTRQDFAEALVKAKKKGVKVAVILDAQSAKGTSKKIVEFFKKEKIPVFIYGQPGLMHHKFVIIDDAILAHGSVNWTKQAFILNDDCLIIMHDLNVSQKKVLHAIWQSLLIDAKKP
jgi:phosphatidylserine/phosphatidylglycerophosphate/cardiolipin synthase-like enzyme